MSSLVAALALSVALTGSAAAQDARPQSPPAPADPVDEIVVIGRNPGDTVAAFVDQVAAPPGGRGLARWNTTVCVGAVNLQHDVGQRLVDRVSAVARDVGLAPGEPGCAPDVLIIGAAGGAEMTRALVDSRPRAFRVGGGGMDRGRRALQQFQTSDAPVRWWNVSLLIDSENRGVAVRLQGEPPPQIWLNARSERRGRIRDVLWRAVVIIDVERIAPASLDQLAAYVAMVALAQVDPLSDTAAWPTILNLFDGAPSTPGLTEWDLAYLKSLYSEGDKRILAVRQAEDVAAALLAGEPVSGMDGDD